MNINVKFEYIEKYLPTPRCRKYRTREVKGICTVTVREAPIGKMVPAFGVEQYIWEETPHIENDVIFSNEGSLWKLSRASRYYAGKSWPVSYTHLRADVCHYDLRPWLQSRRFRSDD